MDWNVVSIYFSQWNSILLILFGCSLIAMTVFIERIIAFHHAEVDANKFLIQLRGYIRSHDTVRAVQMCEESRSCIAQIVLAALYKRAGGRKEIESGMEVAGLREVARLEKHAKILSVIAHITPLIGLLGTVLGFIRAFSEMRLSGLIDISTTRIGEAMEYALLTTAAGLCVAIPCVIAYNYLVSRVQSLVLEMQTTSSEVSDLLAKSEEQYV
jgi:biopolymer transport protein ExbB